MTFPEGPRREFEIVGLSPHADDLALSATHVVGRLGRLLPNSHFHLVTCFSNSQWTAFEEEYAAAQLPGIRKREDVEYIGKLPFASVELTSLGQLDAPLRSEWPAEADVRAPDSYRLAAGDIATCSPGLAEALRPLRKSGVLYFVPLGIFHKDHLITTDAALRAWEALPILFYEDWPYASSQSAAEIEERAAQISAEIDETLTALRLAGEFDLDNWLQCLRVYRSQFGDAELSAMGGALSARGGEIVWATRRAIEWLRRSRLLSEFEAQA